MSRPEFKVPKDYRPLVNAALAAGWTLDQTRTGHPILTSPDGDYFTPVPSSSRDRSLHRVIRKRLRTHGVDC